MTKRLKLLWGIVAAVIAGAGTLGAVGLDVERYNPEAFCHIRKNASGLY